MATNAEIAAQVALAVELALTPAQMVAFCDRAMAEFLYQGKPQVSYQIAGRSLTFQSIEQVRATREYYASAPAAGASPYVVQAAEL